MPIGQTFDVRGEIPGEVLREYTKEALRETLPGGETHRVMGEWRPEIPNYDDLSFEEKLPLMDRISENFSEWLKEKGLYPRRVEVFLGESHPDEPKSTQAWHRDGIDAEDEPHRIPTPAQEDEGEYLKLVWSDTNPTDLRRYDDKTIITTKPYEVMIVNNRLVEHRTPLTMSSKRNFVTAQGVVLLRG